MIGWVLLSTAGGRCVFQIDIWFRLGLEAVLPFLCKEILRQLSSDRSTRYGHTGVCSECQVSGLVAVK